MTSYTVPRDFEVLGAVLVAKADDSWFITSIGKVFEYGTTQQLEDLFAELRKLYDSFVPMRMTVIKRTTENANK